jgi:hypothetical protein
VASKNRIDPFWDKVIVAHNTVTVYPQQEITIEENDGRCARVFYNSRQEVTIETWNNSGSSNNTAEGGESNAQDVSE